MGEFCSHVGAVLFKVEMANRLGFTHETCTIRSCAWNNDFVCKVVPSPVSKITFFKKTVTDRTRATKPKPQLESSTPPQQEQFLDMLMANCPEKPVVLSTYNKYAGMFRSAPVIKERQKLPIDMRTLCQPSAAAMNSEILDTKLAEIMSNLKTNPVEIAYLQSQTLTQHWKQNPYSFTPIPLDKNKFSLFSCETYKYIPLSVYIKTNMHPFRCILKQNRVVLWF